MSNIQLTELKAQSLTEIKEDEMKNVVGGFVNIAFIDSFNTSVTVNTGVINQTLTNFTSAFLDQFGVSNS